MHCGAVLSCHHLLWFQNKLQMRKRWTQLFISQACWSFSHLNLMQNWLLTFSPSFGFTSLTISLTFLSWTSLFFFFQNGYSRSPFTFLSLSGTKWSKGHLVLACPYCTVGGKMAASVSSVLLPLLPSPSPERGNPDLKMIPPPPPLSLSLSLSLHLSSSS